MYKRRCATGISPQRVGDAVEETTTVISSQCSFISRCRKFKRRQMGSITPLGVMKMPFHFLKKDLHQKQMKWSHLPAPLFKLLFKIKHHFTAQYQIKRLVKQQGWIRLLCREILLLMTYCRLNGDTKGRNGGDLRGSDPEWVPCPPVALPHSAPNSWASPTFGQPAPQTNSGVHVPFSELLGKPFYLV